MDHDISRMGYPLSFLHYDFLREIFQSFSFNAHAFLQFFFIIFKISDAFMNHQHARSLGFIFSDYTLSSQRVDEVWDQTSIASSPFFNLGITSDTHLFYKVRSLKISHLSCLQPHCVFSLLKLITISLLLLPRVSTHLGITTLTRRAPTAASPSRASSLRTNGCTKTKRKSNWMDG